MSTDKENDKNFLNKSNGAAQNSSSKIEFQVNKQKVGFVMRKLN